MSDHLPECRYVVFQQQGQIPEAVIPMGCICDRLRACEQRVREEWYEVQSETWEQGYKYAVDAAREAVAAVPPIDQWVDDNGLVSLVYDKAEALAAIDALRGES